MVPRMATAEVPDQHLLSLADEMRPMIFNLTRCLMMERSDVGISQLEVAILMRVEARPGIGISTLGTQIEQHPATIGLAVRRLVQQGRLSSGPRAPMDKRRAALTICDAGLQALSKVRSSRSWQLIRQLRTLPPDDVIAIEHALGPLQQVLLGLRRLFAI
ncbi:hypothetical protein Y886_12010 [Xanthomonas hyacinthi DSM 19077]|nr:hypothetical protein Y886_12010 [Xanthomonas hyacinthi DSM 19077]